MGGKEETKEDREILQVPQANEENRGTCGCEASRSPDHEDWGDLDDQGSHHAQLVNLLNAVVVGAGHGTLASEGAANIEARIDGNHLGQDLQTFLGNGLIVDRNQVLGLGVDLEGLVEGKSSLNVVGACRDKKRFS